MWGVPACPRLLLGPCPCNGRQPWQWNAREAGAPTDGTPRLLPPAHVARRWPAAAPPQRPSNVKVKAQDLSGRKFQISLR